MGHYTETINSNYLARILHLFPIFLFFFFLLLSLQKDFRNSNDNFEHLSKILITQFPPWLTVFKEAFHLQSNFLYVEGDQDNNFVMTFFFLRKCEGLWEVTEKWNLLHKKLRNKQKTKPKTTKKNEQETDWKGLFIKFSSENFLAHMKNITAGGPAILYYIAGIFHLTDVSC